LFSYLLGWLPVQGAGESGGLVDELYHLVLPAVALGAGSAALIARATRSALLEGVNEDHGRTARAKGRTAGKGFQGHVLGNGPSPIVTLVGIDFGRLLGGAAVIEIVFGRPGLGKTLVDAILARDYPLSQAMIIVFLLGVVAVNLATDVAYGLIDPRI